MRTAEQKRNNILEILTLAAQHGCECYITPEAKPGELPYAYGFIVFPDETVMYVQNGYYWGFEFSIQYKPNENTGSGCACNEDPVSEVTWWKLLDLRKSGLIFAKDLGATSYRSADEWKRRQWNFGKLVRV